ncbi:MAG TPA: NAD-dependent epimerase [Ignavibacteriaceae bacterium]|nr:NAD-dependent epimerase [Ignavibacteriaceae bacterium]
MSKKILITGAAGFIGFHLSKRFCKEGWDVTGIDNMNDYYDVSLKEARLSQLRDEENFKFHLLDLVNREKISQLFELNSFAYVVNLAAQAGVRYSLTNPYAYTESNITGFINILEACRNFPVKHLVYASSSSVYGANTQIPFSVHHNVDHPLSLYAATKKANELMAHTYSNLYKIPTTGLRFFTVYGPWGRPDMAAFLFTKAIAEDKPIDVFNNGDMKRDFTYIDDIVEGIYRVTSKIPQPNPDWNGNKPDSATSFAPYKIYNIGNNQPVQLMNFIEILEEHLGKKAKKNFLPMQPGDVLSTFADVDDLIKDVGFKPKTDIRDGLAQFVNWYKEFYK